MTEKNKGHFTENSHAEKAKRQSIKWQISLALQTTSLEHQKGHVYRNFHEVELYLWSVSLTLLP